MRFLADESCDFAVVRALRKAGHDVVAVAEISPRAEDSDVVKRALKEKRVLLTEDKISANSFTPAQLLQVESYSSVFRLAREEVFRKRP